MIERKGSDKFHSKRGAVGGNGPAGPKQGNGIFSVKSCVSHIHSFTLCIVAFKGTLPSTPFGK